MGWLFGRKKVQPKVPFPEGRAAEGTLSLPGKMSRERIIEPEQVKAAAGLERPIAYPSEEIPPFPAKKAWEASANTISPFSSPELEVTGPLFLKLEKYQHLLEELNSIRGTIAAFNVKTLEYNEQTQLIKLQKAVKSLHDRLLLMDKTLFKISDRN